MSSSESRSSSAVRNLRSIFENKASDNSAPDSRGRSPNGLGSDKENAYRPTSKVRASFVPVDLTPSMSAPPETAELRRESFGEADGDLELKKTISKQQEVLEVPEQAVESVNASAVTTPLRIPDGPQLGDGHAVAEDKIDQEPAHPDKPVTSAEEEPSQMKSADMSDELAVSGGEALSPVAEDLRPTAQPTSAKAAKKSASKPPTSSSKPSAISTKPSSSRPLSGSVKSPASQPRTPISVKADLPTMDSPTASRAPRSSLTAPTAASMARSGASEKPPSSKTSPIAKAKPREVTKPLNISSHLTAPTASSKAKHDVDAAPPASTLRTSLAFRPKPQTTLTKPTSRPSLAAAGRQISQDSSSSARKSAAQVDGTFLDRMTRPTAASTSRTAEKVEVKSSPKPKASAKPKANGVAKATSKAAPEDVLAAGAEGDSLIEQSEANPQPGLPFAGDATTAQDAVQVTGAETPNHVSDEASIALEATPAGLGVEDTIR